MSEAIKVVVRVRPMNSKENERGCKFIVLTEPSGLSLSVKNPDEPDNVKNFTFDHVFEANERQQMIYSKTAYNLVENVLLGYNGTIFAYGQTGCGKTHTMIGKIEDQEHQGIIPRSFGHILKSISEAKDKQFLIRCSFIEIYNEEVKDLLGKDTKAKLDIKQCPERGIFIKDLSINAAKTHEELMEFMNIGNRNRSVGETAMNKDSSRSHLLFMLYLESCNVTDQEDDKKYVASKLNLVDLAGSQRLSKTGASGDRLKEAQKINLSLSALGNVISALVDAKSQHIPYRDSKLTRLLQDSLGGNTKTVMIANCSPADYNFDETLSTLRYASRAKFIKNKPIINEDPKDALLKEYANEIRKLKMMLQEQGGSEGLTVAPTLALSFPAEVSHQINARLQEKQDELNRQKLENERLIERIRGLEAGHVLSQDVCINQKVLINVQRAQALQEQVVASIISKEETIDEQEQKIEQQPNSSNEFKQQYKKLVKRLKDRVKSLENELKDIQHENFSEKETVMEDVRSLTKENKLLESIIGVLVQPHELQTIKAAAEYNADKEEYHVPPFYFKSKQLILPKLSDQQGMDLIRDQQDGRQIAWNEKSEPLKQNQNIVNCVPSGRMERKSEFVVKDLIREARNEKMTVCLRDDRKNIRKLHLEPISKKHML